MTASQWWTALEGTYYYVSYKHSSIQPKSSAEDISRLAPPPQSAKNACREYMLKQGEVSRCCDKAADKHLTDRVNINVRFGVHATFLPYDPDNTLVQRGNTFVSRAIADQDKQLWAEVVWELSVLNFHLDLLDLDWTMAEAHYTHAIRNLAAQRKASICDIWNGIGVRPMWQEDIDYDPLGCLN
ncbi:hypothetical protein SCP_0903660 [Sparassis crispa]|uniref:Uncharacterized protein n=1 Tax=Sparassis crispa TaxID=139825 RepID=A0A401GW82_9APHY|nr:hypothetical protein SCP_0903660 [Sparassis crispa]GBE86487.1 hypothetical protein SCP_0903660 [Sparassis crispa]